MSLRHRLLLAGSLAAFASLPLSAQVQQSTPAKDPGAKFDPITHEGYIDPPAALKKLIDVPRNTNAPYSAAATSNRRYFVKSLREGMPTLAVLGKDHYNLAGWQIEYKANRARSLTTGSSYGLELYDAETGKTIKIELPAGARANGQSWSPDGKTFAYLAQFDTGTHIYFADPATGKSRPFTKSSLLATNVTNYYWTGDGKSIVAVMIPDGRAPEPKQPPVATEPVVRVNEARTLRTRTLPDVIESPYEKALIEYHMTGQIAVINVATRVVKKVGNPGMIRQLTASPDAQYFEITYIEKPFSYFQALTASGTTRVLMDQTGKIIRELGKTTLREGTLDDTVRVVDPNDPNADTTGAARGANPAAGQGRGGQGRGGRGGPQAPPLRSQARRNLGWNQFGPGMTFFQTAPLPAGTAADSTNLNRLADRLMSMPNPADTNAVSVIYQTAPGNSIQGVRYSDNGRILFVSETGATQPGEVAVFLDENSARFVVVAGNTAGGRGAAPDAGRGGRAGGGGGGAGRGGAGGGGGGGGGSLVSKTGSRGFPVVMLSSDGKSVFTSGGQGRPTVDRIEIKTGTKTRVYESNSPIGESLVQPLDDDYNKVVVTRQSSKDVAQSFIVDTKTKEAKQITNNVNLWPEMAGIIKDTIYAKRRDNGVNLRIVVTLPAGYKKGTRLPALFWFYPAEFDSAAAFTASRSGRGGGRGGAGGAGGGRGAGGGGAPGGPLMGSVPTYAPRAMALITQAGYALVEPDLPIMGDDGILPNDNYVTDLQRGLETIVNALVDSGYVDRDKLAIGGHSYGGFSTANALVHTQLFKAGIAGDGNYNRTLTPNGFQNERRTLWQGRDTYLAMSPFLYADKMTGALLLYHSLEDENVGTDPINSPKLFHALQGLGKTTAMYMYPYEDHGPVARETVLDQWARWVAWLDKYVKGTGPGRPITP